MPLTNDTITWTTKTMGLTLESYNNKYSIKAVRKYDSKDGEKLTYDWSFPQEYNKDKKVWTPKDKAVPINIYLGDKEQAVKTLKYLLHALGAVDESDVPF